MKTLEITPLKDKRLTVLMVEKEFNDPFWLVEPPPSQSSQKLRTLSRPSVAFNSFLEKMIKKVNPDFATEELGMRSVKEFYDDNVLAKLFDRNKIPFYPVDIDENAKAYLALHMDEKKELRDRILEALAEISKEKGETKGSSIKEEYLVAYGQYLQSELEEQEREAGFPIRESWIVMKILDNARKLNEKEEIACLHITSPEHVDGVKKLLQSLDVTVETIKLSKEVVSTYPGTPHSKEMEDLLQSMRIRVKPVIKTAAEEAPYLLFFLDTDRIASPFDVCMAYDAGFDAVIPYENVTPEDSKKIVQDAIFSRGPKGVKHTCFFIGGKDVGKAEEISEVVKNTMFPPFEASIIIDPGGAYTTAAAAVAKVEEALAAHKLGSLKDKTCAVFGTGVVGRIIAVLLNRLGCNVMILSLNPKRAHGDEYAAELAEVLRSRYGADVQGIFVPTPAKKLEVLKKAEVIFCAAARGVRVIEKKLLQKLKLLKVMADVNAIPPLGIEGIKLEDDMREIMPGIFGVGALTIGRLKHKVEKEMLKEVRRNGKGTYNYNFALELARKLLKKEIRPTTLALTLSYPAK
ncbi:MAG: NAD(P)-dependent methylenetetrahydromethanopterin dehydrogenase [Candidatus Bathyarchaeia archaeon]